MKMKMVGSTLLLVVAAGCAVHVNARRTPSPVQGIIPMEMETAAAWNRGDIEGHVATYADSAEFMAPGPLVGKDRIRESLLRSFWRDGKPLQQLRYEQVQIRPLGADHALMTGRFVLSGGGRADRSGWFTLVWEWQNGRWKIIHDHSS
ncbi:MAG: YybH family protein [Longimicrobiaceae bacterium]